jgi:hypothetical protein
LRLVEADQLDKAGETGSELHHVVSIPDIPHIGDVDKSSRAIVVQKGLRALRAEPAGGVPISDARVIPETFLGLTKSIIAMRALNL